MSDIDDEVMASKDALFYAGHMLENIGLEHKIEKGICELVKNGRFDKLSPKQRAIFDRLVDKYCNEYCESCGKKLSLEELYLGQCECEVRYEDHLIKD